jgi:predicted ribosomally synthesized peptide with nif11-like leader
LRARKATQHSRSKRMALHSEVERFGKDLASNEDLRNAVTALGADSTAITTFANEKGYAFTEADLASSSAEGELDDAQLESVAGGAWNIFTWKGGVLIRSY